ncbi:MAG: CopG family transcriptional regulator [Acidimicrobiia bacterium]|nr:CopG family transcriptional regulator [Acidimicrobiia bacterium]
MKTTIVLPDGLAEQAKNYAAEHDCTFTALVVDGLHLILRQPPEPELTTLPTFSGGRTLVDIADKDAVWDAFDAGARLATADAGFARFQHLRWFNPLQTA